MAKDSTNTVIGGGDASAVYVGTALGVTAPTTLAAPTGTDWNDLGWLSDDGVDDDVKWKADDKRGHQGGRIVRRVYSEPERTFKFQCLEITAKTLGLRFPGVTYTTASGVATATQVMNVPAPLPFIIDEFDAQKPATGLQLQDRWIIPSGTVDPSSTASYKFGDLTVLEFVLTPSDVNAVIHLTNRPAFLTA